MTAVAPPVPAAAAPELQDVVAYLVKLWVTSAVNVVDAVMQLAAEIRAMFGMTTQSITNEPAPTASPNDPIVALLKEILSHSLLPKVVSPALGSALAADFTLGEAMPLTSMLLQPEAPALSDASPIGNIGATPVQEAVIALVAMSLWALLSAALPGLGGLLAFGATGVRIGYRQAKAGITLHTNDFARFARPGPIGIVRTGSLVSVHTRAAPTENATRRRHLEVVA